MAVRPNKQSKDPREIKLEQKSGKGRLVLIITACALLLGAGGGGAGWYFSQVYNGTGALPKPKPPVFLNLETFTVNLQPEHSEQHLQTNLTLKVEDESVVDLIKLHMPEVRNRVLLLLSGKTATQISSIEGKKKLASELTAEINHQFSEGRVTGSVENVLFTSFVIQ
jgi:flagellar protein FliL